MVSQSVSMIDTSSQTALSLSSLDANVVSVSASPYGTAGVPGGDGAATDKTHKTHKTRYSAR
jgi:hypothetical protein